MTLFSGLLLSALGAACGGGDDEPGPTGGTSLATYCQRSADLVCENLAGCCGITVQACVDVHRSACEESGNNAISRGLSFNPEGAEDCTAASQGLYVGCAVPSSAVVTGPCSQVFLPTLSPGATCTFDAACKGGQGLTGVCSAGACAQAPILADGAACGDVATGACAADAYCDATCRRRKSVGESCAAAVECATGSCDDASCGARPISTICAALMGTK